MTVIAGWAESQLPGLSAPTESYQNRTNSSTPMELEPSYQFDPNMSTFDPRGERPVFRALPGESP